jgi:hypothetical protein
MIPIENIIQLTAVCKNFSVVIGVHIAFIIARVMKPYTINYKKAFVLLHVSNQVPQVLTLSVNSRNMSQSTFFIL